MGLHAHLVHVTPVEGFIGHAADHHLRALLEHRRLGGGLVVPGGGQHDQLLADARVFLDHALRKGLHLGMASLGDGEACGGALGVADVRGLLQKGLVVLGQPIRHGMAAQHEGDHDGCLLQGSLGHLVSSFWHFASAGVVWG